MYFIQLSTDAQSIERAKFMPEMEFSDRLGGDLIQRVCILMQIKDGKFRVL